MANLTLTTLEIRNLINLYQSELRKLSFQMARTQNTIDELQEQLASAQIELPEAPVSSNQTKKKKGPGRPKKSETAQTADKPKRGPGRPRKSETAQTADKPKRGPGRPRKSETAQPADKPKRGPGRPRKSETAQPADKPKRGPGRPKKSETTAKKATKKKRTRKKTGGYKLSNWDTFIIGAIDSAKKPLINSELLEVAQKDDISNGMSEDDVKVKISQSIHKLANKRSTLSKTKYEGRGYAYATENMVFSNGKLKKEYTR
jgi:hypothetical protein